MIFLGFAIHVACLIKLKITLASLKLRNQLILTNKEHSFQLTKATDGEKGGVSDVHLLLPIFMKSEATRLPPKQVMYRDFKNFNEKVFLDDVKLNNFSRKSDDSSENYEFLSYQFQSVVNKHAPFKTELSEEITLLLRTKL